MTERFDCHHCEESLFGKKYILREDSPYCVACFETLYASTCEECRKPIGCDCKDLSYKDRHWHEACFHCSRCKSSLVDKPFAAKEDQLLCTDCYSHEYSSKCQECKKTIMPVLQASRRLLCAQWVRTGRPGSWMPSPSEDSASSDTGKEKEWRTHELLEMGQSRVMTLRLRSE